jgi:predicted DNA-binding ribbon-helix-helix protein
MWDVSAVGRIIGGNVVEHLMQEAKSKSAVIKRSVVVNHVRTSVTLENEFRDCLQEIASIRRISTSALITEIADNRTFSNLSSAIRVFVLEYYKGSNAKP